jgi:DNA replication protein DnaC
MDKKATEKRAEILECPKHGKYTGEVITFHLFGNGGQEVNTECPICQKEREVEQARNKRRIAHFRSMNIDERFWESNFDNFDAYNNELRGHLETCRKFAKKPDGKLVMLGENGNGKTHLAISVLKELGGRIYTAYEIGLMLRQSYGGGTNEWEIFNELCTIPLLVIDEVEKIKDSESKQQWVSHVVGKRYNRMLPVIFIANCHTQKTVYLAGSSKMGSL